MATNIPAPPSRLRSRSAALDTGIQRFTREYPIISLRGRRFTTIDTDGNENELNGKTIDVVIVDGLPGIGRKYYDGAYDPDAAVPPACWSNDGQTPAKSVEAPRAPSCASCPLGAKGSGADGQSTACGYVKPLIVYLADDQGDIPVLYRLDCKAMSLFGGKQTVGYLPWQGGKEQPGYVKNLYDVVMQGLPEDQKHFANVVTRVAFTGDSVPAIGFAFAGWVEDFDIDFMETLKAEQYLPMLEVAAKGEIAAGRAAVAARERDKALPAPAKPAARATASAVATRAPARAPDPEPDEAEEEVVEQAKPATRRAARAEPEPAAQAPRRAARGTQEILPPEPEPAATGRRGRAAVPSKIIPATISGDDDGDQDVANLAEQLSRM
jgi:hypothetical protein